VHARSHAGDRLSTNPAAAVSVRGIRTREALLAAAQIVFERDGFFEARIADISKLAGVAHGSFYTHFPSKEDIFREVVRRLQEAYHAQPAHTPSEGALTPYEQILEANRHFYSVYRDRARMMSLVEQLATFDDETKAMRREIRKRFVERAERSIRRWQDTGLADPDLDAHHAASALGSMVDRSVYVWLVLNEPHDPDVAVETLSRLWTQSLGLPTPRRQPTTPPLAARPGPKRRPERRA
jgi:AcrR family transcriptional regulator